MRYIYQSEVQDGRGNFVAGATVTVTRAGGATKASIYSALTGGTVDSDGIITTGTDGTFAFYVDEDDYSHSQQFRIVWSKSGFTSETWDYIQIFPDGDRTLPTSSTVDQGDASVVGTLAWHLVDASAYETIRILDGTHTISTAISFDKQINLVGNGVGSILWLDLDTSTDGITMGDDDSAWLSGMHWRDFAILGGASACKNALVLQEVTSSRFTNVHVAAGTAADGAAVLLHDILISNFNFIVTTNITYNETHTISTNGILIQSPAGAATIANANHFNCVVEGTPGLGLYQFTAGDNGNNWISGTYEGIGDYGIHIKGGRRIHLYDLHLEATATNANELVIESHEYGYIGPGVASYSHDSDYNDVQLIDADYTKIDGLIASQLSIDSDSSNTVIGQLNLSITEYSKINDSGVNTQLLSSIKDTQVGLDIATSFSDYTSIIKNGGFDRWDSATAPSADWSKSGVPVWARETTIKMQGVASGKVTGVSTTAYPLLNIYDAATKALMNGKQIVVTGWIYIPTASGDDVIVIAYWDAGATTSIVTTVTTRDEWTKISFSTQVGYGTHDALDIRFWTAGADKTLYLDAFSVVASLTGGAVYFTPNTHEFPIYTGTATWDPASIAASAEESKDFVVLGAELGMVAMAGAGVDVVDMLVSATVTAQNVVTVVIANPTVDAVDLASSTWNVCAMDLF